MLFALKPKRAVINDANKELILTYKAVLEDPRGLIEELGKEKYANTKETYLKLRSLDREPGLNSLSALERAARFIYLNKTCFNGLYRVNKEGYFNVPFADNRHPDILSEEAILADHRYLAKTEISILNGDYLLVTKEARKGDLVYLDPPYDPLTATASFVSYDEGGFGKEEQRKLAFEASRLRKIGAKIYLSNNDTPFIRSLYPEEEFEFHVLEATRSINRDASKRGVVKELLIQGEAFMKTPLTAAAWERLFAEESILPKIQEKGKVLLPSSLIGKYREVRLMTKFDFEECLPPCFRKHGLSILPTSRSDFLIGPFRTFQAIRQTPFQKTECIQRKSYLDTLELLGHYSEQSSILLAQSVHLFERFLGEPLCPTVQGRYGSGSFSFYIDRTDGKGREEIAVKGAQLEIDQGYEGERSVALI